MGLTRRSTYKAKPEAARMRDCRRAYRLRQRAATGKPLTDLEAAWLAKYAVQAARNLRHATAPPPTVPPARILRAVAARFGVSVADLRRSSIRTTLEIDVARAVAVHALVVVGCTHKAIGALLNRVPSAVSSIRRRQRGRVQTFMAREVEQVLQVARPAERGDPVWVTLRVLVGDPIWREVDRRAEAAEVSDGAIAHRARPDALRDAE